jgi:septal ring factor EnvC (AmiA/AmiB activator)
MTSTPQVQPDLINELRRHVRSFADQHQQLNASRSSLQEERDSLALQLKEAKAELDACKESLNNVFPYAAYREKRPDLSTFNDQQLVEHFIRHGISEGVNLKATDLESWLTRLQKERQDQEERLNQINLELRQAARALSELSKLVIRGANKAAD